MKEGKDLLLAAERISLASPEFAILAGTKTSTGRNNIREIEANFLQNGGRFILTSEASFGKTTLLYQFIESLKINAQALGVKISLSFVGFDKMYKKLEDKYKLGRYEWPANIWAELNDLIYAESYKIQPKDRIGNTRFIQVLDFLAIGATPSDPNFSQDREIPNIEDRGKRALRLFIKDIKQGKSNIKIALGAVNPAVQKEGLLDRGAVLSAENQDVLETLARLRIVFKNLEGKNLSLRERERIGRRIKSKFQLMAGETPIRKVREQEAFLRNLYIREHPEDYQRRLERLRTIITIDPMEMGKVMMRHGIDDFGAISLESNGYVQEVLDRVAYAEFRVEQEMGLTPEQGFVLINPYNELDKIYSRL